MGTHLKSSGSSTEVERAVAVNGGGVESAGFAAGAAAGATAFCVEFSTGIPNKFILVDDGRIDVSGFSDN